MNLQREVDLSKKKVYAAFFLSFPTSICIDVCQRTHAKLSTICRYSFFVANYGGMMKVLSLHILMFGFLLEGCDSFQVTICKGIELCRAHHVICFWYSLHIWSPWGFGGTPHECRADVWDDWRWFCGRHSTRSRAGDIPNWWACSCVIASHLSFCNGHICRQWGDTILEFLFWNSSSEMVPSFNPQYCASISYCVCNVLLFTSIDNCDVIGRSELYVHQQCRWEWKVHWKCFCLWVSIPFNYPAIECENLIQNFFVVEPTHYAMVRKKMQSLQAIE